MTGGETAGCRRVAIAAAAILFLTPFLHALFVPESFPPGGFVNDYAGVLTQQEKMQLEQLASGLEKNTGAELAIAVVPSLDGDDIDRSAVKLFEYWNIGKKGKDNGILILVAVRDRKARVEVGYGLEPVVTDVVASRLINEAMAPKFREGDYYGGLFLASSVIAKLVEADRAEPAGYRRDAQSALSWVDWTFIVLAALFVLFLAIFFIRLGWGRYGSGGFGGLGGGGFDGGGSGGGGSFGGGGSGGGSSGGW